MSNILTNLRIVRAFRDRKVVNDKTYDTYYLEVQSDDKFERYQKTTQNKPNDILITKYRFHDWVWYIKDETAIVVSLNLQEQGILTGPYGKIELILGQHFGIDQYLWISDNKMSLDRLDFTKALLKVELSEKEKHEMIPDIKKQLIDDCYKEQTKIFNSF